MTAPAKRPLKLLHLHSTFDAGGKERRVVALMNRWAKGSSTKHLEHHIVSAVPAAMGAQSLIDKRVKAFFPFGFPPLAGKLRIGRLQRLARAMQGFDLVLTYNWGAMDAAMAHAVFAPGMGLPPLIHHEDGFNADEAGGLKRHRNWYRMIALSRASALIVPSRNLEQIALTVWNQPRGRVQRIANGIDTALYTKKPRPDVLPRLVKRSGEKWLGTLAGLRAVKNLPRMVRAMQSLPPEWHLVILGEGPEREAILAEAIRLEIGHRVHLPGHVADPSAAIGLFDLFALSSDSEQAPLSVIEAMASGLAVASPAVGDVADMVAAENHPFISAMGDEPAFAKAIATLAADDGLRQRIGTANRMRAKAEFDEAVMAKRYVEVYAQALGRSSFD
ncbi:MAG: glycosyl transferase family 1 [Novosphingobium sp. 28-62-57]|uniref:glycosyltransferase family 4 protein n=1 Tax=unclassified Novosphingobium TaxID=2644732 RepID=UPI000BD9D619|nr:MULTISPECIES: glycosyltransferase family 4 protein [unclassified Novosphingobium]OYW51049.1 MAG: glycosyl transferase family 1 [Novosphingobium sp. 12-62-10]OYZ11131.1 MAG: glycosyl transferase family 1 [Novosphingobium sp. 28-62-57]OYZ43594.1 MAG: glycosyl transferase family 1 [Novosphingobium sp. 16-62-11]HQS71435.1 glycosyltransferase family 4 protein [Novosphingobium sp.]